MTVMAELEMAEAENKEGLPFIRLFEFAI